MAKILVMGAYGLLGAPLCKVLTEDNHSVLRQGRKLSAEYVADPTHPEQIRRLLDFTCPDAVINLNAMTNVDACEQDPQAAYQANVRTVEILTQTLEQAHTHLIQVSTDQLYDDHGPHSESEVNPCNVYGLTKYAGELVAQTVGATVLRTNFVGRSQVAARVAFTDWLVNSFREKRPVTLFDDVVFSALHASALCRVIEHVATVRRAGTYNVGCSDSLSKAAFALGLAQRLGLDSRYATVGQSRDIELPARRPLDMSLNVQRFEQTFQLTAPTMKETLECVAKDYEEERPDA